jgi:PAS domain S-box-containing protein
MIDKIEQHPFVSFLLLLSVIVAAVVGIMSNIVEGRSKWRQFREIVGKALWLGLLPLHAPWTVTRAMVRIDGKVERIGVEAKERDRDRKMEIEAIQLDLRKQAREFQKIAKEMTNNGGESLKDVVTLLRADFKQRILHRTYPYFMADATGRIIVASRGLCELVGVEHHEQLNGYEWRKWLFNEDQSMFVDNMNRAIRDRTGYRVAARMVNASSRQLGRWEWVAEVALPKATSPLVYLGFVRPADEEAHAVSDDLGFRYPN